MPPRDGQIRLGALYRWSRTAGALLAVRVLHGAGMGLSPTAATAAAADLAPPGRRGETLGVYGRASMLALALGPVTGIWLVERFGFTPLFLASAGVAALAFLLTLRLGETAPALTRIPFSPGFIVSAAAVCPSAILFCLMVSYGVQVAFLPLSARALGGGNPGLFFLVFALVAAALRGYGGRLSDRLGRGPVTAAGMLLVALALAALARGGGGAALVAAGALYGAGFGGAQPALAAWTVDRVPAGDRGKAMGTFFTAHELGIDAGASGIGVLVERAGFGPAFLTTAALALAGGVLAGGGDLKRRIDSPGRPG
jgi:MFS family permease